MEQRVRMRKKRRRRLWRRSRTGTGSTDNWSTQGPTRRWRWSCLATHSPTWDARSFWTMRAASTDTSLSPRRHSWRMKPEPSLQRSWKWRLQVACINSLPLSLVKLIYLLYIPTAVMGDQFQCKINHFSLSCSRCCKCPRVGKHQREFLRWPAEGEGFQLWRGNQRTGFLLATSR